LNKRPKNALYIFRFPPSLFGYGRAGEKCSSGVENTPPDNIFMNDLVIKKRKPKEGEIDLLVNEIRETPFIVGLTKREWGNFCDIFVANISGFLAGVCVVKNLSFNWVEIGPILVLKKYRGKNIGQNLFDQAFDFAESKKKNIYIVSRNPVIVKWMEKRGMVLKNNLIGLPWPILWHDFVMVFSLFRIFEFLRKSFIFRKKSEYIYGYKLIK